MRNTKLLKRRTRRYIGSPSWVLQSLHRERKFHFQSRNPDAFYRFILIPKTRFKKILCRLSRQTLEGNGMKDRHLTLNRSRKIEKSLILFLIRIPNLTAPELWNPESRGLSIKPNPGSRKNILELSRLVSVLLTFDWFNELKKWSEDLFSTKIRNHEIVLGSSFKTTLIND